MISARRGPIPGTASRSGSVIRANFDASFLTIVVGATIPVAALAGRDRLARFADLPCFAGSRRHASASAAAVPEVPMTSCTFARLNPAMCTAQFSRNQPPHPRQFFGRRGIDGQKLLGQPHRSQRNADRFLDPLVF